MTIRTINAHQARQWLAEGEAVLIDVREPDEYRAAHIPYALSLPLGTLPAALDGAPLPANARIITQCLKGGRGAQACATLSGHGIANDIYNLEGGITAWTEAGLPVVRAGSGGVSIFRQVQMIVGLLVLAAVLAGMSGFPAGIYIAGFFGLMLAIAGFSGWCGMALLLQRMPWNR